MNQVRLYFSVVGLFAIMLISWASSREAAAADNGWSFQLAPYGWPAGQNGPVGTLPGQPPTDIDVDFWDDVLGNINGALFLVGEARKDRWGIFLDTAWVDIESESPTPGPNFSSVSVRSKSWVTSLAGLYRLMDEAKYSLDLLGGVRFWSVETTLELGSGAVQGGKIVEDEDWIDPILGVKGRRVIGDSRFFVSGMFMLGGFGAASDLLWDLSGYLGYQWTEAISTVIGYRYLDVDYEDDGFIYDIAQDGPVIGLSWQF